MGAVWPTGGALGLGEFDMATGSDHKKPFRGRGLLPALKLNREKVLYSKIPRWQETWARLITGKRRGTHKEKLKQGGGK